MKRDSSEIAVPLKTFVGSVEVTLFAITGIDSDAVRVVPCWDVGNVPTVKALYSTAYKHEEKAGILIRIVFDSAITTRAICLGLNIHPVVDGGVELLAYRGTNEWDLLCAGLPENLTREDAAKDFYLKRTVPDVPTPCSNSITETGFILAGDYRNGRSRNYYWHYAAHDPTSETYEYDHAIEISRWAQKEVQSQNITLNPRALTTGSRGLHVVGIYDGNFYGWHFYFGNGEGTIVVGRWDDQGRTFLKAGETWESNWGYAPQYKVRNEGNGDFPTVTLVTDI